MKREKKIVKCNLQSKSEKRSRILKIDLSYKTSVRVRKIDANHTELQYMDPISKVTRTAVVSNDYARTLKSKSNRKSSKKTILTEV